MTPEQSGFNPAAELHKSANRAPMHAPGGEVGDLHICTECDSDLVHPIQWAPVDRLHWRVELRCPECELRTLDLYRQRALDRFDLILDDATQSLIDDLARLEQANMEDELERFIANLAQDLVLPEDF